MAKLPIIPVPTAAEKHQTIFGTMQAQLECVMAFRKHKFDDRQALTIRKRLGFLKRTFGAGLQLERTSYPQREIDGKTFSLSIAVSDATEWLKLLNEALPELPFGTQETLLPVLEQLEAFVGET